MVLSRLLHPVLSVATFRLSRPCQQFLYQDIGPFPCYLSLLESDSRPPHEEHHFDSLTSTLLEPLVYGQVYSKI